MLDTSAKEGIFKRTRLVIVDRQPIVLQGLKSVLGAQADFEVIASCSDGTSCIQAIRSLTPDIALLADTLPDLTASEILAIAKAESLSTRLVFFTDSDTDQDLTLAVAAGACDAIAKYAAPDAMLRSLRLVTKRSVFLEQSDPSSTGKEAASGKIEKLLELLTPRERQIVRLVSKGMSNKEIADQLNVSDGTVKVHLHNIFQKLEITNRTVLATLALLQRPSGFGMFSLALLAVAVADKLKASEVNHMLSVGDHLGPAAADAEYELWKRAILLHVIDAQSDEKPTFTDRDVSAEVSQISSVASAIEALRTVEQSAGSKSRKDYNSVGSSTPDRATPSLQGINVARIGGDPTAEDLFSRGISNPTLIHAGYGTFVTLTGALIYALSDSHLALLSHDPAKAPLDNFSDISGDNAATKLAAIINPDDNHVDHSATGFFAHDSRLPSAFVIPEKESAAGEGTRNHVIDGTAGETLQTLAGLLHFAHDADIGGYSHDQLMDGDVDDGVVHRSAALPNSTSSGSVFNFASGPSRINLAAFGALAWLHMTAASKSIPPHTVAWIFNSASNETVIYVNSTDHVLEIGDRGLMEVHLQGTVSIAEADLVGQPTDAAAAIAMDQLEAAVTSVTATGIIESTESAHTDIGTSEGPFGTAGVWDVLTDVGLRTEFAPPRTPFGETGGFGGFIGDPARTTDESVDGAGASADASSSPCAAVVGSAGDGNSQDVLEPWSAKEAGAELTEAGFIPRSDIGGESEHQSAASATSGRSANTAETDCVEHGKPVHSTSTNAPEAAKIGESRSAAADNGDREKSQHAHEQMSARAPPPDVDEVKSMPGHRAGNDHEHGPLALDGSLGRANIAEPGGLDHSNSHASERGPATAATKTEAKATRDNSVGNDNEHHSWTPADTPGSAKMAESSSVEHGNKWEAPTSAHGPEAEESVATAGSEDRGSTQHAAEPEPAKAAVTTELAEIDSRSGKGAGDSANHGAPNASASAAETTAKLADLQHGNPGHNLPPTFANASETTDMAESSAAKGGSAGNGNSQQATQPAAIALVTAQPAKTAFETGVDQAPVFRFNSEATPFTLIVAAGPKEAHIPLDAHDPRGQAASPDMLVKILYNALDEHAANQSNSGPHHSTAPAPHDLLI